MNEESRKWLYNNLRMNGLNVGNTYEDFAKLMDTNEESRKWCFDQARKLGYNVGKDYDTFNSLIGPKQQAAAEQPTTTQPQSTPTTQEEKADTTGGVKPTVSTEQPKQEAWKPTPMQMMGFQMQMDESNRQLQQMNADFNRRMENMRKGSKPGASVGEQVFNPQTWKFERKYYTITGEEVSTPWEQSARNLAHRDEWETTTEEGKKHCVQRLLNDAYAERDRLNARLAELGKQEDAKNDTPLAQLASASNVTGGLFYGEELTHKRDTNYAYRQLHAALEQNRKRIIALEAERDNSNGLGRAILDTMKDPSKAIFENGYIGAITGQAKSGVARGDSGKTEEELEADKIFMEAAGKNEQAQAEYAANRGAMYRFGQIGAGSIPFMAEFMLMGGANSFGAAGAKLGIKAAEKLALEGAKKTAMKYTGTALTELAGANLMANTLQGGRTGEDIVNRALGGVVQDENGDYQFAGGDDWATAIYKGEMAATLENYSEMLGGHLSGKILGGKALKGLDKIGLSSVSNAFRRVGTSHYAQLANKVLEKGGFNGYFNEVAEEEANIILNSMLVGDNSLGDLVDGRTQLDIWGGLLFSCGAMEAVPRGLGAVDYYRTKHKVNKADRVAAFRLTEDRWQPLREQIDETPNEQIADVAQGIIADETLWPQEKQAALDYIGQLVKFRGFNTAQTADAQERAAQNEAETGETAEPDQKQQANQSYIRGYDADEQERRDVAMELAAIDPSSPEYAERQEAWNGVVQSINDNADLQVTAWREGGRQVQHTDGSLHRATLKEKDDEGHDKTAYIVSGNVQMMPDGTMVDPETSDKSVIIYDPATGEKRMIDPTADTGILSVDAVETFDEYEARLEQLRAEMVQNALDEAQGKVKVNPNQQITLPTGEQALVLAVSGDNITVQLADGTQAPVSLADLQRAADEAALADYKQRHGITDEQQGTQDEAQGEQAEQEAAPSEEQQQFTQPTQAATRTEGAPAEYTPDMELTIRDEDGTEKPAMVMGRVRYEDGQFVPDAQGSIVEYLLDGEVHHDHIADLNKKISSYSMPIEEQPQEPVQQAETVTEPATEQKQPTDEESVITEGIAAVGEGLRDAVNEQAADVRENDINNWLQHPAVADAMRKYGAGAQSVDEVVQRALADNPSEETAAALNDIMRFESSRNLLTSYITPSEQQEAQEPMPMTAEGEEDWFAATPERSHAYIYNEAGLSRSEANEHVQAQLEAAESTLIKARQAQMPKMGTSIKKFNEAKAKRQEKIDAAQRAVDYWKQVRGIQSDISREERRVLDEQQAALHDQAVAQAEAEFAARKQAAAERAAVGNENPMPQITERWNAAPKADGVADEIVLPNGERIAGHYVLTESGAASASHQALNGFQKTEGFPMDANDNTVNDRDYERDTDAQQVTRGIAAKYDSRALQTPVVVSADGVVLSGNGRTMAGELAANDNTDGAYIDYLKQYAQKYGFTSEQVAGMQHPRVVFVPDERMPYTAETFAKFNQQEMKSQSKTEHAVKLGKTVPDDAFKRIVRTINGYDTLGDFYNDPKASLGAVYELSAAGVIPQAQLAEMTDGVPGQEKLSAVGREMLENTLIGKAFADYPEAVRMLTAIPSMRQSVITALGEISDNITLGEDWALTDELADAVKLVFDARTDGYQHGDIVSVYARQSVLFADPDQLQTVADFNNAAMLMLADVLNDKRVTLLKQTLSQYNGEARVSASGQRDIFTGDVRSREEIIRDILTFINNGRKQDIEAAHAAAVERRKAESVQQNGDVEQGNQGNGEATNGNSGLRNNDRGGAERQANELQSGVTLTAEQKANLVSEMKDRAEFARELELTPENWDAEFGEDGIVKTPIGNVKMGENQYLKLLKKKRDSYFGMIRPTLTNPDMILEEYDPKDGAERATKYLFVKTFIKPDGSRYVHFESVTVQKDNLEVSISSHEVNEDALSKKVHQDKLIHLNDKFSSSDVRLAEHQTNDGSDIVPTPNSVSEEEAAKPINGGAQTEHHPADVSVTASTNDIQGLTSADKVTETSATEQENEENSSENSPLTEAEEREIENQAAAEYADEVNRALDNGGLINPAKVRAQISQLGRRIKTIENGMATGVSSDADMRKAQTALAKLRGQQRAARAALQLFNDRLKAAEQQEQPTTAEAIEQAEQEVNTNPTEAQKEAGNYKKGHVTIGDFDISIEQPKGSTRSGTDPNGQKWSVTMHNTYGYIRGTEGVDGDHIDVFLADNMDEWDGRKVFVIDQTNTDGSFDEHKCMLGFNSIEEAEAAYYANYSADWKQTHPNIRITGVNIEDFNKWIESSHRKTKPFAEYSNVKPTDSTANIQPRTEGYTIEARKDTRDNSDLYAVKFDARVSKEEFKGQKGIAKKFGGYWSNFGKKGFLFKTEEVAHDFAETVMGRSKEEVEDEAPLSLADMQKTNDGASEVQATEQAEESETPTDTGIKPGDTVTLKDGSTGVVVMRHHHEQAGVPNSDTVTGYSLTDGRTVKPEDIVTEQASEETETKETEQPKEQPKQEKAKPTNPSGNKLVTDERYAELRERMRKKLLGQMNMGIDPEILSIGTEMAVYHIEKGARKFADYAKAMIEDLGDVIRPYLKSFYNGARDLPEMEDMAKEMSPYDEVAGVDITNFDKQGAKDLMATAENIMREQEVEREKQAAEEKLQAERNRERKAKQEAIETEAKRRGLKRGDKVLFKRMDGKEKWEEATITDFGGGVDVTLDTGGAPVIYEAAEFDQVKPLPKANASEQTERRINGRLVDDNDFSYHVSHDERTGEVRLSRQKEAEGVPPVGDARWKITAKSAQEMRDILRENHADNILDMIKNHLGAIDGNYEETEAQAQENPFSVETIAKELTKVAKRRAYFTGNNNVPALNDYVRELTEDYMNEYMDKHSDQFDANIKEYEAVMNGLKGQDGIVNDIRKAIEAIYKGEPQAQEKSAKEKKSKRKAVTSQTNELTLFGEETETEPQQNTSDNGQEEVHVQTRPSTTERETGHEPRQDEPLGESQQHEAERPNGQRVGGRSAEDTVSDAERGGRVSDVPAGEQGISGQPRNTRNNHAERGTDYAPRGENARIEANIKAIETMQRLIESGEQATPEDMAVLRKFSGWGGLGAAFKEKVTKGMSGYNPQLRDSWQQDNPTNKKLRNLLTPEQYEAANMSRNSAYYTPATVIDAMWDVARAMGFKGGSVLEGSAGIGNIIGLMPQDMSERSDIHAVEIDDVTGQILSLLYPDAQVDVQGFEKTRIPNGSVDLAITNVPFVTGLHVLDETGDKDLSRKFRDIHDFCIAKNVRKLREGGIGIFITSSGTLDNSAKLRQWLTSEGNADVVGAFRLHNKTFGGTGATSDIIVVRKRVNGKKSANAINVSDVGVIRTVEYDNGEGKKNSVKQLALDVNKHYVEHPEDMAGEMAFAFEKGETFRATSKALYPVAGIDQEQRLTEWASRFKDMDWERAEERETGDTSVIYEQLGDDVKEGSMFVGTDGKLKIAHGGKGEPVMTGSGKDRKPLNDNKVKGHTKAECFNAYKAIKDALAEVLAYQTENEGDSDLQPLLKKLNSAYDSFVKTYGHLNKNTAIAFLRYDIDFPSIAALEAVSETGDKQGKRIVNYGKTDIFSRRVVEKESEPKPTNIKDGIITSIYLNGRIDVPYIAAQLGLSEEETRQGIIESGLGFENPATTEIEVSYEYLSGNVREKLHQARELNTDGRYDANIKALEEKMPLDIPAHLIEFSLGSSWIEPKLYEDYVRERTGISVTLTNAGGTWIMQTPYYTAEEKNKAMGVISEKCGKTILGHELIGAAITCKNITVSKTVKHYDGSTETIVDKEATTACLAKIDEIKQDFRDWAREQMQANPEMAQRMERVYNEQFNNYVPCEIPDDFVPEHFGGAAYVVDGNTFKLRRHQAKAVIRSTMQPVMLAHEVGTGKTYTLITTAMEMRRLGTAHKPMIVVQNATVGQFVSSAKKLYPNAKILTLEDADRNAEGRKNFYAKIRYNDWDMIVIPQSVFERIPDSEERQARFVEDKVEEKLRVLEKMRDAVDSRDPALRQAERELEQLYEELNDHRMAMQTQSGGGEKDAKREAKTKQNAAVKAQELLDREVDDVADFDDMGIDALLVDEAHEYKHLGFATAMQRGVKGVDPSPSKKSQGVYLKTQAVLEKTGGRNVVFATGTPISNTAAEIWTFMRYLMPADTMREYGIFYFDDFVRNFGNVQQMLEFGTNGKYKENNRFAGYVNLPELVRIWAQVADTVLTREAAGVNDKIPEMEGGAAQDVYLPQTLALRAVMKYVREQLEEYDKMSGKEKKENSHIPVTMYGIAKAAAVDARLVLEDAADEPNSKTNEAVRQALRSLEETKDYKGTVAIFADNYQNKHSGFNLYEDIRKKLIDAGVPAEQIVVMKSGMSIKKKLEIFDKVNRGDVRVVMGSTFTLGTGVNIQERLHTLIHVDAPNRPMDYTQRNGRILRQGNLHKDWGLPVRVLRFGVEDSLDVTAYQRLKTKGAIADSIMEGKKLMQNSMENRVLEEEQDIFGDITAQLSGSQYALLKNQVEKDVRKMEARRKAWEADQTYIHNQKPRLHGMIKAAEERQAAAKDALAKLQTATVDGLTVGKQHFASVDAMADFIKEFNSKQRETQEQVRKIPTYGVTPAKAERRLTVSVGGYDFEITSVITKEQKREKGQLSLAFFAQTKMTYSCPELGLQDVPVKGQQLKAALEDIMQNVMTGNDFREQTEAAERSIARYRSELEQIEAREGKPFEYADDLKQAKKKLAEYEEAMKKEMAEKEAKYAEMDSSVETATNVQLTEEDSEEETEDSARYRLREDAPPTKTGIGYKVFVLKDGKLYPPMVANPGGEATPVGVWLDADAAPVAGHGKTGRPQVQAGGKGTQGGSGKLAYRPGWHLGEIPYALQFNRVNPETGVKELFPANFVWAEVEYADDVDYQEEAMSYGKKPNGKFQHSLAGLPRLPENGSYRYRTNPNPETDPWIITGAMRVKRILTPTEVDEMVEAAGREPQERQAGAVTDRQVEELNRELERTMQTDTDLMRKQAEQIAGKLNVPVRVVTDASDVTHKNPTIQARRRKAKGWYDTQTGEVVINLTANKNAEDVAATVFHEIVGHKGLRELVGEESYSRFLQEVYNHATKEVRQRIAEKAAGMGWNFEKATDEYLAELSEKGFEDFTQAERTIWQRLKKAVLDAINKFLKSLKLPSWVRLGDNELRYMLWRSHENLVRGKEHPIDVARDIVKRGELGLTEEAQFRMGDARESFAARQKRAVERRGTVMRGLNDAEVNVVDVPRHAYDGSIREATRQAIAAAKAKYAPKVGGEVVLHYDNHGAQFDYSISGNAIEESLNPKQQAKSDNKGVHLALAEHLDEVIGESIEVEEHPDYISKDKDGNRTTDKIYNDALMHRFYGVVRCDGKEYRVMTLMRENRSAADGNGVHAYEVTKIEVLNDETPSTPNGRGSVVSSKESHYPLAKLLQNVGKSYEKSKNLLEESRLADEDTAMYRDPIETEDIWKDQSMGLHERITAAATRLAANHQDDKKLRNDAMRAIGGNLADLRKAMSLQRTFDMTTVKRVADLVRVLMNGGYLDVSSQQEVKRLLAVVKNSVGHNDIEDSVQKVMDIMVDNQLKRAEHTLHHLETIKGSKVDARGIEVQGQLDTAGQHTMKVFKKARGMEENDIQDAIAEQLNRMGSNDAAIAEEAAQEYAGLQLALEYVQNIRGSKAEEEKLRTELKQTHEQTSERDRATDSYRQYVASVHDAIRQNKIERAQAYFNLVGRLSDSLRGSIANATAFKETKKQRIREIQHNANSDMEGRPSDKHRRDTWQTKLTNNGFVQFFFSPLQSFDQILRLFGNKSANGEGYLYNRFMRGWIDAREKELRGVAAKYEMLDEKVQEVFGKSKMKWTDLIRLEQKLPKATVSFWNGGEMQDFEMPQGNLLYIYMVNKMLDGRMKLRKMGVSEQDVARIENFLDPRLKELGDWLQEEFLVETRNEYNETHKRLFGASMAAIEDYFPLKILKNARADKAEELDAPNSSDGISTKTGSIIKRRRNALALDLTNADAFSVVLEHITQMEHWNAYAEWNNDLNTLRTYKHFRNQVQNMASIYGGGKKLWENFNKLCQMAAGSYRPPRTMMDEAAVNFAKGVSAAKVNFRLYTAFKQLASMPIYTAAASAGALAHSIIHPFKAWNWAMENLPLFRERWASHQSGDPRLLRNEKDWKMWRSRVMELSSRIGMLPNAFVDAVTVSIGSHAVYETAHKRYLREGYSEEQAERKALQDAELSFNQMQMTSEGAFLSPVQVDNSWLSVALTVFRRDSIAYGRMLHDALRNIKRNLTPGQREQSIAFMAMQIEREGLTAEEAERAAKTRFNRQFRHDAVRVAVFGFIVQALFNFLAYMPYLLVGGDDDEKEKLLRDWLTHSAFSGLEGLNGGDVISLGMGYLLNGEGNFTNLNKDMPLTSDVIAVLNKFGSSRQQEALSDVVNILVQSFAGVNPQTLTDAAVAVMDACGNDLDTAHESALLFMRISQVPQSQLDKLYFDEIGLSGEEASKYTPAQLAERYARYKVKRGAFFTPWNWGNEERLEAQEKKATTTIKERTARLGDDEVNEAYLRFEEIASGIDEKVKAAKKALKNRDIDYTEYAGLMSEAQSNREDYMTFQTFKALEKNLDKVTKFYLTSKSAEEAALCQQAIIDYKAAMVGVLNATDAATRNKAIAELSSVMQDFLPKYTAFKSAKQ